MAAEDALRNKYVETDTSFIEGLLKSYHDAMSKGDRRVELWPLVASPIPVLLIVGCYISFVLAGPTLMRNREAFSLKWLIMPYNFALICLSAFMFYELLVTSILSRYSYRCQPVDYTKNPLAMRMASAIWWFFFSKVLELLDTVLFIMRKKFNQVSFLHVYHHSSMILIWWSGVKYVPGGQSFFIAMTNSFVHVLMYSYYFLSGLGPHMQKYLWWKRYLTRIQLVQFFLFVIHSGYNLFLTNCNFHQGFNVAAVMYSLSLIVLFGNFYYQSYSKTKSRKLQ